MTIQYELTFDDFREARNYQRQYRLKKRRRRAGLHLLPNSVDEWWQTCVWLIFGGIAFALYHVLIVIESPERAGIRDHAGVMFDLMAPMLALFVFSPVLMIAVYNKAMGWRGLGMILAIFLCLALSALLIVAIRHARAMAIPAMPPRPSIPFLVLVAPHLSWMACLLFALVLGKMIVRTNTRASWNAHTELHLTHTLQATVEYLTISTPTSTQQYQWPAITVFLETPNLFLLLLSDEAYCFVPKRALVVAEERDAFHQMLRTLTADVRAFPVVVVPLSVEART